MRRSAPEVEGETTEALTAALVEMGLGCRFSEELKANPDVDLVIDVEGHAVAVEVKTVVGTADAEMLVQRARRIDLPVLIAAERIAGRARETLKQGGVNYFDRRGRLRLVLPGVFVDAETTPRPTLPSTASAPLSGEVAKEAAIVLLARPDRHSGVREIARVTGRAPSTVSVALQRLRSVGLVTSANEPLLPELFWELEGAWHRQAVALASAPHPDRAGRTDPLQLGFGNGNRDQTVLSRAGWALTDTLAATAWGMPVIATSDYPPDFYVPSASVLSRALSSLGQAAGPDQRGCTVSLPPARLVCRMRTSHPGQIWPTASHIVVALDLAKDRARGRDVLERWRPEGIRRVW